MYGPWVDYESHIGGEMECIEYDNQTKDLLVKGFCRRTERKLRITIPNFVRAEILRYFSQMEDIWVDIKELQQKASKKQSSSRKWWHL